jgi:Ni,Fe-hydrogenase III large subunit
LNLDTQMGWKHKGVEKYFYTEKDLNKLLSASQDIAWDSAIAYGWTFARLIEDAAGIKISKTTGLNRILALELERIYNHMWTIWALGNDVGQSFLLNWYLSIREDLLELQREVFGSRTLKWVINFWNSAKKLSKEDFGKIENILKQIEKRVKVLAYIEEYSSGVYDRFKDTWIVTLETTSLHSGLGLGAKASRLAMDERVYDKDYLENKVIVKPILGIQWDSFDRFQVRAKEIFQSISLVREVMEKLATAKSEKEEELKEIKLKDGLYTSFVEGHRWEIFQMMLVENGEISYFKAKDPSFVNWTLIEYAVLKNIIADFPICNKSYDLSYSGTDM